MFKNISFQYMKHTIERIKKHSSRQSSNFIFLHCVQKKKINKANIPHFSCKTDFNDLVFYNVSSYRVLYNDDLI